MQRYVGGTRVKRGYYVNGSTFAFANIVRDGDALPGGEGERYLRLPTPVVLAAAPAVAGLFVMLLPFIGFGVVAQALGRKIGLGASAKARDIAAALSPGPVPGEAHLAGTPAEKGGGEGTALDGEAKELAKAIEEKRSTRS
ncbi:MAG TPA: hypothetical protein VLV17_02050 [Anaeromyxobacteraceae bacterium]|nr:hypothetical protein [Anaeromyxobacteraceae bacterium]